MSPPRLSASSAAARVAGVARPGLEVAAPARAAAGRRTSSATPSRSHSSAQCASSAPAAVAQPVVAVQRGDRAAPASRTARSSRQTESRPPESSTSTGRAGRSSPPARTGARRSTSSLEQVHRGRTQRKAAGLCERSRRWRAMRPAASAGGVRDGRDALRRTTAPHFPAYCLVGAARSTRRRSASCQRGARAIRPRGADTRPRSSRGTARRPAW